MHKAKFYVIFSIFSIFINAKDYEISPGPNAYESLQEAMILMSPGDSILIKSGEYFFEDSLSLDVDNAVIRGEGLNATILNFKNQKSGAQGILVTSNKVVLRDFAVIDAKGDAIKVIGADGIAMINLRTEWTGGPKSTNGAYGLYPVESKDVYIDGCIAIGASDAGIYVGQSKNIIVKNSQAMYNVAGIEIENSYYADVFNNKAQHNTGGILVFDLPDLPQQGGHHVRVFNNKITNNDTDNFAPEGNIVGEVPRGTGIIVQANSQVEIFQNNIGENDTVNIAVVSYQLETEDKDYYPHPSKIQIHNNSFGRSGFDPDLDTGDLSKILFSLSDGDMPDIFWDGVLPLKQMIFGQPDEEKLVLKDNGDATFLSIQPIQYMLSIFDPVNRSTEEFETEPSPLREIVINRFW
ncbi:MAG: parallel beta-helix domain-containing protein [Gammaproteobacteria bacterium]